MSQATALLADAETSIKAGEWDRALEQLEILKTDEPDQPEVYEKLAHVLAVRGKFQSVILTYLELAQVLVSSDQLEHADGVVSQVLALRPDSGEARERRIEIENKRGNVSKAVSLSRELARLCIDQGDGERSIRLLQDAQQHEPSNLDISLELAEMFVSHGHIQDGANQYRKVANAFQEVGNISKAAEAYRRMKVVQSDDPEVLLTLGGLYTQLGKLDEAEQEFRSVLRHDLDHEEALLQLGYVCQLKGRFRSGILAFNKVLQNNADLVLAKRKLGELHHSQGMMTEAVDFFLQAAQGHLEADEKDSATECFQIVLGVDENNATAQQGLTNLGAALTPKAFEPPQPPQPVEEVPEEPAAAAAPPPTTPEPTTGGVAAERTERLPAIDFEAPDETEPPKPKANTTRPSSSGGSKGPRRGLIGSGLSIKHGLIDPNSGGKPMLGEKPTLGGPSRGGMRRGLGLKTSGMSPLMGDKPLLGSHSGPGGDRRPSLGRSESFVSPTESSPPPKPTVADASSMDDFSADMALENVFSEPPAAKAEAENLPDSPLSVDSGFDAESVSEDFDSIGFDFDDTDAPAAAVAAVGPVIGSFTGTESSGESESSEPVSLKPDYALDVPDFDSSLGDDLFDFDAATPAPTAAPETFRPTIQTGAMAEADSAIEDDLFGDASSSSDDLFGDDSMGGGDLFGEAGSGSTDLFGETNGVSAGAPDLFSETKAGSLEVSGASGLFEGESDPFENLFDEASTSDEETGALAATIGGVQASSGDLLFDESPSSDPALAEQDFGSLFGDPSPESEDPIASGSDLLGSGGAESNRDVPDLFVGESGSDNLFDEPDMFSSGPAASDEGDLFGSDSEAASQDDLFSTPEISGGTAGDLFSDAPTTPSGSNDLFSEGGSEESVDLFAEGLDDLSSADDLFGDGGKPQDSQSSEAPVPTAEIDDGGQLFGEPLGDDLFGSADLEEPQSLFDDPEDDSLFGSDGSEPDDLFGDADASPASAIADPSASTATGFDSEGDLFGGADDLFGGGDPQSSASDTVVDAPGLELEVESNDLFGDDTTDEPEPPALDFDIPSPVPHSEASEPLSFEHETSASGETAMDEARDDLHLPLDFAPAPDPVSVEETVVEQGDALQASADWGDSDSGGVTDSAGSGSEFHESSDDLFSDLGGSVASASMASVEFEEPEPLIGLDLPMPGDPPASSRSSEETEAVESPETEAEQSFDLFGSQETSLDFGLSAQGESMFDDEPALPLDLDLPMPGDPPLGSQEPPEEPVEEAPPVAAARDDFDDDVDEPLPFDIPELPRPPEASAEPLPDDEEDVFDFSEPSSEIPEAAISEPLFGDEPVEISVDIAVETETFTLEPVAEEPAPEIEEVVDLLSKEEKMEILQTEQADQLEASLADSDVATKIAAYRKSLEDSPDNLILRTRLADIHLKFGLLEDAVVQYRQVMRRNPDSVSLLHSVIQAEFWNENYVEAGDSLLALAHLHLKRDEHHDALDALQSVLSLDPLHFEARKVLVSVFSSLDESKLAAHHLRQLAETALTKGEVDGAISAFQQLLEISDDPTFEERLAQIYESQGDVEKALASFQSLVGRYRVEERWEEAARVTERIVEIDPTLLEEREALITLYQKLGQGEQAVEQQFRLARLYQGRGELKPAIDLFEAVVKHQVDNFDARRCLVDAYLDSGNVASALEQTESLTEHYLNTKDHDTAITLYSRFVDADPENVELQERLVKFYGLAGDPENAKSRWIHLSHLHEQKERYDKAAEAVRKALELDPNQVELQHRLAVLYAERLGDGQGALGQLRRLFEVAPDRLDDVKMYIDILLKEEEVSEAGQVLQRLEQAGGDGIAIKNDVINSLRTSVENNPSDTKARFNYGELCYHLGDLDHAIEQFQQTRRHPDFELMSYNMLGLCFASKKGYMMLDLAVRQFKKGLESKGRSEQDYLEIRYNLAMVQYQNGRANEALAELKECYNADIAYRDVRSWIQKIESELANSGS